LTGVRLSARWLAVVGWCVLLLGGHVGAVRGGTPGEAREPVEGPGAGEDGAARGGGQQEDEGGDEASWDRGRSFLYKEIVVSTSFSRRESDGLVLSHHPPGSYVALDYVRTFTAESRANRALPGWLELGAIDLHPRAVYHGKMPDSDMMAMGEGVDWPMADGGEVHFAPQDFWVRFQLAGNDRLTLRVGQFVLPYGGSPLMAPRQTFILPVEALDLGLKWDWGLGIKGPLGGHEWELAATVGSGEAWHAPSALGGERPASRLFSGRVGSPSYWNFQYGLSALVGALPTLHGPFMVDDFALSRRRLSVDGSYKLGTYLSFGAQATYGHDGHAGDEDHVLINQGRATAAVLGYRAWADWVPAGGYDLRLAGQFEALTRDRGTPGTTESAAILEISYSLTTEITVKLDYRAVLEDFMGLDDDALHLTVVYYGS